MSAVKQDDGIVNIHGKQYLTVAKRVNDFRAEKKYESYCIVTDVKYADDMKVVVRCEIIDAKDRIVATGHSEEFRAASKINRTSALENAETSAIGRALASLGIGGTEFASANEVQSAIRQQESKATSEQVAAINSYLREGIIDSGQLMQSFGQSQPSQLLEVEAGRVIAAVIAAQSQE